MAEWSKIKAEYIRGDTSVSKLAEKYGLARSTVAKHMKDGKWSELRRQKQAKSDTKIADALSDREANAAGLIYSATEALLAKIAQQIVDAQALSPTDAANYTNAIERCKRIVGIKDKPDAEEQQARIAKIKSETAVTEEVTQGKVIVIPARVAVEEEKDG